MKLPIYIPYKVEQSKSVIEALNSGWVSSQGLFIQLCIDKLKQLLNVKYAILTNNGTSSTHCIAMALKFKHPTINKIYVPDNVYVAAINSMLFEYPLSQLQVLPMDYKTLNIDLSCIDKLETNSALLIVHNIGIIIDTPLLRRRRPDIVFIEDACEAFMANYTSGELVGSDSLASSFSFYANKIITCGEGGLFVTNDKEVYEHVFKKCHQGQTNERYVHDTIAYNYRMTNIQAALLYDQILLLQEILTKKKEIFREYYNQLQDEIFSYNNSLWMMCCKIETTISLKETNSFFERNNIEIRPMFYPLTKHSHLKNIKYLDEQSKLVSNRIHKDYFIFPSYPSLLPNEIVHIANIIKQYRNRMKVTFFNPSVIQVKEFISSLTEELNTFRYFKTREFETINNHVVTLLVRYDDTIVGYGHIDYDKSNNRLWLGLVVSKQYQTLGLGTMLIKELIKDRNDIYLSVNKDNTKAISLYVKNGFKLKDEKTNYFVYCMK